MIILSQNSQKTPKRGLAKFKPYLFPALLVLVILNLFLNVVGIIPVKWLRCFIWIAAGIEAAFFLTVIFNIRKIVKRYRQLRAEGLNFADALQGALETVVPPTIAKLAIIEPRLYYALYRSLRPYKSLPSERVFPSKISNFGFLIKAIAFVAILETLAVQFIIPDKWWIWKMVHLLLVIWTFVFLLSYYRSMLAFTHVLNQKKLLVRMGVSCEGEIALRRITEFTGCSKVVPEFRLGPIVSKEEPGTLYIATGDNCNVMIDLEAPQTFTGLVRDFKNIKRVYLSLQQPEDFIRQLKEFWPTESLEEING